MPAHWVPCPGKTNTARAPGRAVPRTTSPAVSSSASSARPLISVSRSAATTAPRWSNSARSRTSARPTAYGVRPGSRRRWTRSARAWPRSASGVFADSSTGTGPEGASTAGASSSAGACSMMACALVPLRPNEETPARRGAPVSGHGRASVSSSTPPADQSIRPDGSSTWSVRGSTPCRMACTILITPATPAAACVWPMFDFRDPSHSGLPSGRAVPYVASSAWASIGSPSVVPVPCASTASTWSGLSRALASAARITSRWEGPLGAVSPLDAPSWLTAVPRTTASTRCPRRRASDSRSRTSMPAPSAKPVPSADSAKDLHRPSGARPWSRLSSKNVVGVHITVTPPASAREQSPWRSAWTARCSVTSDDEQAVSTVSAGPSRPVSYTHL